MKKTFRAAIERIKKECPEAMNAEEFIIFHPELTIIQGENRKIEEIMGMSIVMSLLDEKSAVRAKALANSYRRAVEAGIHVFEDTRGAETSIVIKANSLEEAKKKTLELFEKLEIANAEQKAEEVLRAYANELGAATVAHTERLMKEMAGDQE